MEYLRLIDVRNTGLRVPELDMKCDAREIPAPLDGSPPLGWWAAQTTSGFAISVDDERFAMVEGPSALAICSERVMGIVGPEDARKQALWWTLPLAELVVETAGSQGIFRKRPSGIKLTLRGGFERPGGCTLTLSYVVRLFPDTGKTQWGQEQTLLDALLQSAATGR